MREIRDRASEFLLRLEAYPCCAATTVESDFDRALDSRANVIVILRANGLELRPVIERIHARGKLVVVHVDLISGLRADRGAVRWLADCGVDALISSRGHLMSAIRHEGVVAIQRLLLVHHSQIAAGIASIKRSSPQFVEVLPGVVLPQVRPLLPDLGVPLLAGGFVRTAEDVREVLAAGAVAVTTSTVDLWNLPDA